MFVILRKFISYIRLLLIFILSHKRNIVGFHILGLTKEEGISDLLTIPSCLPLYGLSIVNSLFRPPLTTDKFQLVKIVDGILVKRSKQVYSTRIKTVRQNKKDML